MTLHYSVVQLLFFPRNLGRGMASGRMIPAVHHIIADSKTTK